MIPYITELPVGGCGVDIGPEDGEQLGVTDLPGVVDHLHGFRMAGRSSGNLFVGRIVFVPPV